MQRSLKAPTPKVAKPLKVRPLPPLEGENPYSWHVAWAALAFVGVILTVLVTVAR